MATSAEVLVTVLGLLVAQNPPAAKPPLSQQEIHRLLAPQLERYYQLPAKRPPVIRRCKWPCERSA